MKIASAEFHLRDHSPRSFRPDVSRGVVLPHLLDGRAFRKNRLADPRSLEVANSAIACYHRFNSAATEETLRIPDR